MEKDKRLIEASWWERLTEGETGSCSDGRGHAQYKKFPQTYSSTLAWKIPWMEECSRLQYMGSQRVGHEWATSLQTTVEVMEIGSHACTAILTAPNTAAGHHWLTALLETPGHSRASLGQFLVGSLLLSPGPGAHKILFVPCRSLFRYNDIRYIVILIVPHSRISHTIGSNAKEAGWAFIVYEVNRVTMKCDFKGRKWFSAHMHETLPLSKNNIYK